MSSTRLAGVELGGTKTFVLLAQGDRIVERVRIPTTQPDETLAAANAQLRAWHADAPIATIGIASFGPIALSRKSDNFGHMLPTPKPGWAGADIAGGLTRSLDCPMAIDTDVNGAALAEHRWGAGRDLDCFWYITIGTGIGGGLLVDGKPVHGAMHPEIGHIHVRRAAGDSFAGACPFHGDCIEGLVSGPALAARFGTSPQDVADDDPRWGFVAADLAQLAATLFLTTAAERILLGGTVATSRAALLPAVRTTLLRDLGGYLPFLTQETVEQRLCLAGLGDEAGPLGAIALAMAALQD
ncbi:fructokinase [Sphingobium sp. B2D3A]|uniref:ROK family protein n=1 Tax=unclassified Sphingobium TaxID=2611147 RepID=UPI002225146A|nr:MULTISPECIES: ROK family protein [unclassified Sphingobium]MCW2337548.1 fructokinase [Sphingobium sp. B2D3A]MCW2384006.1 fructokinase [Sphingobium sp. B2D3D]